MSESYGAPCRTFRFVNTSEGNLVAFCLVLATRHRTLGRGTHHVGGFRTEETVALLPSYRSLDLPLGVLVEQDIKWYAWLHQRSLDPFGAIVNCEDGCESVVRNECEEGKERPTAQ